MQTPLLNCVYNANIPFPLKTEISAEHKDFPYSSVGKESACNAEDLGSIPGSGRCPGEGNGHPFQYSWLENPMDRGSWKATVHGFPRVRHGLATKLPLGIFIAKESETQKN